MLQSLETKDIILSYSVCTCQSSEVCYEPAGHIITGDLNIVHNEKLRDVLSKGPKYRQSRSLILEQNLIIFHSVEAAGRRG